MTGPGYVISTVRPYGPDLVIFEVVTDALQRLYVQMRSRQTDAASIDATIRAAIAGLAAKPSPVR